jgi:hypothetical protein
LLVEKVFTDLVRNFPSDKELFHDHNITNWPLLIVHYSHSLNYFWIVLPSLLFSKPSHLLDYLFI